MNSVEKLEGMVAMAIRRITFLETVHLGVASLDADEAAAQRRAEQLGFSPAVLFVPQKRKERIKLAIALRDQRWSVARIARVMRTGERNIERWIKSRTCPDSLSGRDVQNV